MGRGDLSRALWRRSSRSSQSGNCVESASVDDVRMVRDSKDPYGPVLAVSRQAWRAFVRGVKDGQLDR